MLKSLEGQRNEKRNFGGQAMGRALKKDQICDAIRSVLSQIFVGTEGEDGESWWELCRECTAALCLKDNKASYASDGSRVGGTEQTWNL